MVRAVKSVTSSTLANPADSLSFSRYPLQHITTTRPHRGGAAGIRTPDLRRARAALSQTKLRPPTSFPQHAPLHRVGAPGLEPGTSALSGPRSNHLSYAPSLGHAGLPFHVWNVATHALRRCAEDEAKPVPWSSPRFLPHRGAPARPRIAPRSTNTPRLGPL